MANLSFLSMLKWAEVPVDPNSDLLAQFEDARKNEASRARIIEYFQLRLPSMSRLQPSSFDQAMDRFVLKIKEAQEAKKREVRGWPSLPDQSLSSWVVENTFGAVLESGFDTFVFSFLGCPLGVSMIVKERQKRDQELQNLRAQISAQYNALQSSIVQIQSMPEHEASVVSAPVVKPDPNPKKKVTKKEKKKTQQQQQSKPQPSQKKKKASKKQKKQKNKKK